MKRMDMRLSIAELVKKAIGEEKTAELFRRVLFGTEEQVQS